MPMPGRYAATEIAMRGTSRRRRPLRMPWARTGEPWASPAGRAAAAGAAGARAGRGLAVPHPHLQVEHLQRGQGHGAQVADLAFTAQGAEQPRHRGQRDVLVEGHPRTLGLLLAEHGQDPYRGLALQARQLEPPFAVGPGRDRILGDLEAAELGRHLLEQERQVRRGRAVGARDAATRHQGPGHSRTVWVVPLPSTRRISRPGARMR